MRYNILTSSCVIIAIVLTGCNMPKVSYLDPTFPKISYEDIKKRNEPLRLKLATEFRINGGPATYIGDDMLREYAAKTLQRSGVVLPDPASDAGEIRIVVNGYSDMPTFGDFAMAVISLGIATSNFTHAYEMTVTITAKGKTVQREGIWQAYHDVFGLAGPAYVPADGEIVPLFRSGFELAIERMILLCLQDMQQSGELSWQRHNRPADTASASTAGNHVPFERSKIIYGHHRSSNVRSPQHGESTR